MSSLGSKSIAALMKILNYKNKLYKKITTGVDKSNPCLVPPESMVKDFNYSSQIMFNCPVYTISPKTNSSNINILYLHGGTYVNNFNKMHWKFICYLVKNTNATITAVDYPLAPKHTVEYSFDRMSNIYKQWVQNTGKCLLMGDSAGAGMALSLNMWAKLNNIKTPDELILLSPWVDISTNNPKIDEIQKRDPFISAKAVRLCADSYAGNVDKKNYMLSPMFGDLTLLSKTHIFYGTRDILYPDIDMFCKMASDKTDITGYVYPDMIHDFALFSFREAKDAKQKIVALINK